MEQSIVEGFEIWGGEDNGSGCNWQDNFFGLALNPTGYSLLYGYDSNPIGYEYAIGTT